MEERPMPNLSATTPLMALIPKPFTPATPTGRWELLAGWSRAYRQFYGHLPYRIDIDVADVIAMATPNQKENPISTISKITGCNDIYVREEDKITLHYFMTVGKTRLHGYSSIMLP